MSIWFQRLSFASFASFPACGLRRQGILWLSLLLVGCAGQGDRVSGAAGERQHPGAAACHTPLTDCDTLWQMQSAEAVGDGLYWLRAMTCAERLTRAQARAQAHRLGGESWQAALTQSLLVGRADPSVAERRQILDRLTGLEAQIPVALQPLIQLWRTQQAQAIQLQEEKARYQRLLASSEAQLESLRDERQLLQARLEETRRKLENLTDIERQLSSRKQRVPEAKGDPPLPTDADTSKEP